jgi:peptide-methionine (S)-S-oxide reductase
MKKRSTMAGGTLLLLLLAGSWVAGHATLGQENGQRSGSLSRRKAGAQGSEMHNSGEQQAVEQKSGEQNPMKRDSSPPALAMFGAGCFWCVEAVFAELDGVLDVESGYAGGAVPNPTYKQVRTGQTGHAEVVRIRHDPQKISFSDLLEVFWAIHDPTTLNRQGNDIGPQYRSVIFYRDDEQKRLAEASRTAAQQSGRWQMPIVTQIVPWADFYKAEEYHQDYFRRNPQKGYCTAVIRPKLEKFRKSFAEKLKK